MGIGTTLAGRVEKELSELPRKPNSSSHAQISVISSATAAAPANSRKKIRRRSKRTAVSPVQRLFNTCKEVFANGEPGIVPSPEMIERLRAVLEEVKPEDVGVNPQMPYFRAKTAGKSPVVTYLHIYKCDKFSMGIFCLPPSGVIPLHNHPGMTVFSKLLFGTMHIKSYDWVLDAPPHSEDTRLAKVKVNSEFVAPCESSILYPSDGGNMHCFTAQTSCAVLDVLGPPYDDPAGRHCSYYFDFPFSHFSVEGVSVREEERKGYAWLKEREEKPEDLTVVAMMYTGPTIKDR
ncbi:PREDICTED: plant cysteine oxidase 2-like [Tarenaya hassleriana]|uniref:plant cysteine oxidase 2-like n=1 Tax=Tarenaya hassleriana TaxID=28532 RepID=UPI00053C2C6B|nr:PREDICTED: plant cysteine oxidase 2-like [Tarenaya hassleriana]